MRLLHHTFQIRQVFRLDNLHLLVLWCLCMHLLLLLVLVAIIVQAIRGRSIGVGGIFGVVLRIVLAVIVIKILLAVLGALFFVVVMGPTLHHMYRY